MSNENLRRLLLCLFASIIAFGIWFSNYSANRSTNHRVDRVESPCLKYGSDSKICQKSFSSAIKSIKPFQVCIIFKIVDETPAKCDHIQDMHKRNKELREQSSNKLPHTDGVNSAGGIGGSAPGAPGDAKPVGGEKRHSDSAGNEQESQPGAPPSQHSPGKSDMPPRDNPSSGIAPAAEEHANAVVESVTGAAGDVANGASDVAKGILCPPLDKNPLTTPVLGC